jgi:hypothetical protein
MANKSNTLGMRLISGSSQLKSAAANARNPASGPTSQLDPDIIGSWLCDEGRYDMCLPLLLDRSSLLQGRIEITSKPLAVPILD